MDRSMQDTREDDMDEIMYFRTVACQGGGVAGTSFQNLDEWRRICTNLSQAQADRLRNDAAVRVYLDRKSIYIVCRQWFENDVGNDNDYIDTDIALFAMGPETLRTPSYGQDEDDFVLFPAMSIPSAGEADVAGTIDKITFDAKNFSGMLSNGLTLKQFLVTMGDFIPEVEQSNWYDAIDDAKMRTSSQFSIIPAIKGGSDVGIAVFGSTITKLHVIIGPSGDLGWAVEEPHAKRIFFRNLAGNDLHAISLFPDIRNGVSSATCELSAQSLPVYEEGVRRADVQNRLIHIQIPMERATTTNVTSQSKTPPNPYIMLNENGERLDSPPGQTSLTAPPAPIGVATPVPQEVTEDVGKEPTREHQAQDFVKGDSSALPVADPPVYSYFMQQAPAAHEGQTVPRFGAEADKIGYTDKDGDRVDFAIENGKLILYVNGNKRPCQGDGDGVVTSLTYKGGNPADVRDQLGMGNDDFPWTVVWKLKDMADAVGVPNNLPRLVTEASPAAAPVAAPPVYSYVMQAKPPAHENQNQVYVKGEQVQILSSGGTGEQQWFAGVVEEVFHADCVFNGFDVKAGVVLVRFAKGSKFVPPQDLHKSLRKASPTPQVADPPVYSYFMQQAPATRENQVSHAAPPAADHPIQQAPAAREGQTADNMREFSFMDDATLEKPLGSNRSDRVDGDQASRSGLLLSIMKRGAIVGTAPEADKVPQGARRKPGVALRVNFIYCGFVGNAELTTK